MKKNLLFKSIALAMLLLVPFIGNAQRLLTENFEYPTGNLTEQSEWTTVSSTSGPLIITTDGLTYQGYQDIQIGGAVTFQSIGEDAYIPLGRTVTSGDIYVSALVNLSAVQAGNMFLTFAGASPATGNLRGKLFAKASENGKVLLGVARQATSATSATGNCANFASTEYELNSTVLVVMKYSFIAGEKNDIAVLYINPDPTAPEPETAAAISEVEGIGQADASEISSLAIYQLGSSFSNNGPTGIIDAIRVSTTWEGLFDSEGGGEEPDPTPILSTDQSYIMVQEAGDYNVYLGREYPFTVNIKGQNLKGDISISISETSKGQVTSSVTSISKADAESENGVDVPFLLKPNTLDWDYIGETLTFSSEGAAPIELPVYWQSADLINVTDIADFRNKFSELSEDESFVTSFLIQGKVLVSHAYEDEDGTKIIYVQDATGGLRIEGAYGSITTDYQIGDELTNLHIFGVNAFGVYGTPTKDFGAPLSQGNAVEPVTITLADLKAQGARYEGCLVKVENVTFEMEKDKEGIVNEGNFGDEGLTVRMVQNDTKATLNDLPGADFIGKPIPESARSITGISTSSAGTVIAPRNLADIDADFEGGGDPGTDPEEPGNEVEVGENLFLDPSFEAGKSNPILGLTFDDWNVTGAALESTIVKDGDAAVRITGAGTAKIQQEISALQHTFAEGEAYRLKLNYYVVKSQGDNDVQLQSSWEGVDVVTPQPDDLLQSFSGALSTWENKAIRFVVPAGRQMKFIFKLNVPKNAEVIFDNFGLYKLETIATGIGTTEENILSAWCENGVLCIESNRTESIDVYNLHGMLVNRTTLVPGVNTLNLSAGAYLVKAGTETMKVLVK